MNGEQQHKWQPGERALLHHWANRGNYEVTIIRYSRAQFGRHHVLVKRDDGKRFTIHESLLSELPKEARPK